MKEHVLKLPKPYFDEVQSGAKPFEVRRDDRGFQKGDILLLRECSESTRNPPRFSGRVLRRRVSYILTGGQFGIEPGFVVMGLEIEPLDFAEEVQWGLTKEINRIRDETGLTPAELIKTATMVLDEAARIMK